MASSAYHAIFFCTHLAMTRAAGDVLVLPAAAGSAATRGRGRDVDIMWEGTVGGGAKRYSTRMKYRIETTRAVYVRSGFCYEAQYRLG